MLLLRICKFIIAFFIYINSVFSWGFWGHKLCNQHAVFALPEPLFAFYRKHIEYITIHSTDPDSRRYILEEEACRHYIDIDHYEVVPPIDTIPLFWLDAKKIFSEDSLIKHGIVPWYVNLMYYNLKDAFSKKDIKSILKISADLGHYIADAHVPLHATSNYNGQKTNQNGIHALWESRIPERWSDEFDLITGKSFYISNVQRYIWEKVSESFACVDSVLMLERVVYSSIPDDKKYGYEVRGRNTVRVYSDEYTKKYYVLLNEMVERRLRESIISVSSIWYTAWVDAGMPDLLIQKPGDNAPRETDNNPLVPDAIMIGRPEE